MSRFVVGERQVTISFPSVRRKTKIEMTWEKAAQEEIKKVRDQEISPQRLVLRTATRIAEQNALHALPRSKRKAWRGIIS